MLILSLAAVDRGETRVEGEISPDDPLWEGTTLALHEPLHVELRAQPVGDGILVRGPVRARLSRECRRCLAPVQATVDDTVEMLFEPLEGDEAEELAGEVYPLPSRGDSLDLGPALREQLLLRVPEFVVCSESCRGLCPQCGTNRNEAACTCVPDTGSGPWDALKKINFD